MSADERGSGGKRWSNEVRIYDFKFIAVVFEEDYFLLKQTVGEELGGVRDNESGGGGARPSKFRFVYGDISRSVTIRACDAKRGLTAEDEKGMLSRQKLQRG